MDKSLAALPGIPAKRYFTIGEVSELCGVKPYVLRYWEQEFTQLKPMKRRGNRRYYQHHEVLLIRRIRELLYDQGFTISGARNRLGDAVGPGPAEVDPNEALARTVPMPMLAVPPTPQAASLAAAAAAARTPVASSRTSVLLEGTHLRAELLSIRALLGA
jgi:DNA-binding transcriptional MerR regulator